MRGFTVIILLHRDAMIFILFQDVRDVDERIGFDGFRDGGEER